MEHPAQTHHGLLAGMEALLLPLEQTHWQRYLWPFRVVVVIVGVGVGVELGIELFDGLVSWWYISWIIIGRYAILCVRLVWHA